MGMIKCEESESGYEEMISSIINWNSAYIVQ